MLENILLGIVSICTFFSYFTQIVKCLKTKQAFKINTLVTIRESLIYELETILEKANIFVQE